MISIIIPTYNHKKLLTLCLASISKQTYKNFEIIVIDDGSDEDLNDILLTYPNIIFFRQTHQGAPAARNKGFSLSRGKYIIFLDDDIIMHPDMLLDMKNVLDNNLSVSYVYSSYRLGCKVISCVTWDENKLKKMNYIHTSSLLRREDFPGFDESLKKFQDWDLWLTMLAKGKKGLGLKKIYYKIIKPKQGHISTWLPSFLYTLPWPIIGWTPKVIKDYFAAKKIIQIKHNLIDSSKG